MNQLNYDHVASSYDRLRSDIGIEALKEHLDELGPGSSVLDVGCGTGRPIAAHYANREWNYVGIELSEHMAKRFKESVPLATCIIGDMTSIDLGDHQFELAFSWGALCHLEPRDQMNALQNVGNHVKSGGHLIFTGGQEEGEVSGRVGEHETLHYSIGQKKYDMWMMSLGFIAANHQSAEGDHFLYIYKKLDF